MEMKNDCPETFSTTNRLPMPISGLNIWPPSDPNVTTRDIYDCDDPISYDEIKESQTNRWSHENGWPFVCATSRGERRGNFVVNPEWLSEEKNTPPKTVRTIGKVYEPSPPDFFGARDLHAKTWEQARIHPGHGVNPHMAIPGYAPYKHVPVDHRTAREDIGNSWPWNQSQAQLDWKTPLEKVRPRTAAGAYYTDLPTGNTSKFDEELNKLHDTHVQDRIDGGKPDIETRQFTRSNREIMFGFERKLNKNPYVSEQIVSLPQPFSTGGHREVTDLFAHTYARNLPQMHLRRAQHAHAPFHAYMSFCDWGEPPLKYSSQSVAA